MYNGVILFFQPPQGGPKQEVNMIRGPNKGFTCMLIVIVDAMASAAREPSVKGNRMFKVTFETTRADYGAHR